MSESPIQALATLDHYRRQESARKRTKVVKKTQSSTQKKALQLLIRESSNAKSSRLKSLLTRNMIKKFGTRKENTLINRTISESVDQFMASHPNFQESDLPALEEHVRSTREDMARNRSSHSRRPSSHASNQGLEQDDPSSLPGGSQGGSRPGSRVRPDEKLEASWAVLNTFKEIKDEDRLQQEIHAHRNKADRYRRELEEQLQEAERKEHENREHQKRERERFAFFFFFSSIVHVSFPNRILREVKEEEERNAHKSNKLVRSLSFFTFFLHLFLFCFRKTSSRKRCNSEGTRST